MLQEKDVRAAIDHLAEGFSLNKDGKLFCGFRGLHSDEDITLDGEPEPTRVAVIRAAIALREAVAAHRTHRLVQAKLKAIRVFRMRLQSMGRLDLTNVTDGDLAQVLDSAKWTGWP